MQFSFLMSSVYAIVHSHFLSPTPSFFPQKNTSKGGYTVWILSLLFWQPPDINIYLSRVMFFLRNQFNEEKAALEKRHVEEMALAAQSSRVRDLTADSKHQLESLHSQLQESSEARGKLEKEMAEREQCFVLEVELSKQKIAVLQEQLGASCKERLVYEQESRNNFEKELTVYKQDIENLNFQLQEASKAEIKYSEQLDECKKAFEAELLSLKQSHEMELSVCKEQIDKLKLQLQEASKAEANYCLQLAECKKISESKLESVQQSHEMELASYKQRIEALNLRLQELPEAEESFAKVLASHKQCFEFEVSRCKEENEALRAEIQRILLNEDILRKEKTEILESHSATVSSYEEQLAQLKLLLQTAEEAVANHERDLSSLKRQLEDSSNANEICMKEVKSYKGEIITLKMQLEDAVKVGERFKQDFAACKKAHEEEINLMKQKNESEWAERDATAKCQSHETELALCKEQIEFINSRLRAASEAEKCHILEITACHTRLEEYKEQVVSLNQRFKEAVIYAEEKFSIEMNSKNQEVAALEEKYKSQMLSAQQEIERLNMQVNEKAEAEKKSVTEMASCQEKLTACMDEVQALKAVVASQDDLQAYKQQMETLKERLCYELSQLRDFHAAQLKIIEEEHAVQIASFNKQVDDLTARLSELSKANEILEQEKSVCHESHTLEVDRYKQQLDELNTPLQMCRKNEEARVTALAECREQLNVYKNLVQLLNAEVHDDMCQMKILHTKEVNDLGDELQHLKNIKATLEAEVSCLNEAVKHGDGCCKSQLEEITVQFLKTQSLFAAKEEVEKADEGRITDLQVDLDKGNQSVAQMKRENDQLHEINVQYLKLQGLLAAKEETECMLIERVIELEQALCTAAKDLEQTKQEGAQRTQKSAKTKEPLKNLKFEKGEVLEKHKHLEAEWEKLVVEKEVNEEKLKDLASQMLKLKTSSTMGESSSSDLSPVTETCAGVVLMPLELAGVTNSNGSSSQAIVSGIDNTVGESYSGDGVQISESGPLKTQKLYAVNVPEPVVSLCPSKWMGRLIALEREKTDLGSQLETLELKYKEKELQECLHSEETHEAKLHYKEVEDKLRELENVRIERDMIVRENSDLELKVVELEHENATFQKLQKALNLQLAEEKMANEEKLYQSIKERLGSIVDERSSASIENLILELGCKAKEIVYLKETLRSQEQTCQLLHEKILTLEKSKAEDTKRINLCHDELARVYSELEESWKQLKAAKEELGTSKKELAMLYLQKQQLESSNSRLLHMSTRQAEITPVYGESLLNSLRAEL
jgi:chromosome segregation ATPase